MQKEEKSATEWGKLACNVLIGGALSLLVCLGLLLATSAAISFGWLSDGLMPHAVLPCCALASFLGGSIAVHRQHTRALIVGGCTGLMFFLLIFVCGLLFCQGGNLTSGGPELLAGSLCGGLVAGLAGTRRKKTHRKK